jgi:hypothetical protein
MKESTMHMIIVAILLVAVVILGKVAYDKMQKNNATAAAAEKRSAELEKIKPQESELLGNVFGGQEYYRYNTMMNETQRMSPIDRIDLYNRMSPIDRMDLYNRIMNQKQRMPLINPMDRSLGDFEIPSATPSATPSKESFSLSENLGKKSK